MESSRWLTDAPQTELRCPQCIDSNLHSSRVRFWERPVVAFTRYRPFRCHRCGWRGWRLVESPRAEHTGSNQPGDHSTLRNSSGSR